MGKNLIPQFGLRIPQPLRERLEKYCSDRNLNLTQVILAAIDEYLKSRLF